MKTRQPDRVSVLGRFHRAGWRGVLLPALILLVGWTAAAPIFAQQSGVGTAAVQEAAKEAVLRETLDNGLQAVIVRNPLAPVAATVMTYRVGAAETPEGSPGMAHALEHMMFRGSPGLTADQLAAVSASLGGDNNAQTRQTVTQYYFTVPAEDLQLALRIEALRMQGILSTTELWSSEKGAIEQEVAQDLSNPLYVFHSRLIERLFRGTVYARDALGTRESFDRMTADMLQQFHRQWYGPNNAVLVIVGDVDPAATLEQVRELFGGIPPRPLPPRPPVRFQPVQPDAIRLETDRPYGLAFAAFRLPGTDDPDYPAAALLAAALASSRGPLYRLVLQGRALFAGFALQEQPAASVGYAVAAFPRGGDGEAMVGALKEILASEARGGIDPDLVESARRREIADLEFQKNSVSGLALAWSEAVAVEGRRSPEEYAAAVRRVTLQDVSRVARERLDLEHSVTAILTPGNSGAPTTPAGGGSPGGKESLALQSAQPVTLPGWAEAALRRLSVPEATVRPVVSRLANGLQLLVQPATVSGTVSLYGTIDSNSYLQEPAGREGLSRVLDGLFDYGTTSLDRAAYHRALDEIAADISVGTSFSLEVLAEHFERGTELLADLLLHPALPADAFQTVRKQLEASLAGELESPGYRAERALYSALLPKGDPVLREATPQTIASISLEEVRAYHRRVFRPDMTAIVVIGRIAPEEARRVVEKQFGGWSASGPRPNTRLPPAPPNGPAAVRVPDASRVQAEVTLAQTLQLTRSHPDYYPLELGNHVLGGAFYATRLYRALREAAGLVYSVESILQVGRSRGFYLLGYACDPANVPRVRAVIVRNLRQMQTTAVSEPELNQTRSLLLREIPLSQSSIEGIAGGLLDSVRNELPLDEPVRAARLYLQLSARQVQEAFARWVRPDDLVQVIEGPAPK